MAESTKARSAKSAKKDKALGAEDLRLKVYPGTAAALQTLMERHGYAMKGEAMSTMLINLAAMSPDESAAALKSIRHKFELTPNVARVFHSESLREIAREPGDEIVAPDAE